MIPRASGSAVPEHLRTPGHNVNKRRSSVVLPIVIVFEKWKAHDHFNASAVAALALLRRNFTVNRLSPTSLSSMRQSQSHP